MEVSVFKSLKVCQDFNKNLQREKEIFAPYLKVLEDFYNEFPLKMNDQVPHKNAEFQNF